MRGTSAERTGPAARRWAEALAVWAIPDEILEAAPESPWSFPADLFARRADHAARQLSASNQRALEALPERGSVLDVGCGGGAASLPLASHAGQLIGVDPSTEMLQQFRTRAGKTGAAVSVIEGTWPEVADDTPVTDVVVCHHVVYNASDLVSFGVALSDHARRRVVIELTEHHPLRRLNDLWMHFHAIQRPEEPTADDAVAVLNEIGVNPQREDWMPETITGFPSRENLVAFVRRRLCLTQDRDPEIDAAIADRVVEGEKGIGFPPIPVVTLWWDGWAR
ncbi:MAG: methyltransferase domain-containing protein [Actinomycetota bacterium]|nr:methyltransferase domain-containing protein [Actinomycetota bacterium]